MPTSPRPVATALLSICLSIAALAPAHLACAANTSTARDNTVPPHVLDMVPPDAPATQAEPSAVVTPPPTVPAVVPPPTLHHTEKPSISYLAPAAGAVWYDGQTVTIRWVSTGPIAKVKLYYYGERTRLGGKSRGDFGGVVNDGLMPNSGEVTWKVPWVDSSLFNLALAGFDSNGQKLCYVERRIALLPREFSNLPDTCIAVSKRVQRLYYFKDGTLKRLHVVSTAAAGYTTPTMRPGSHSRRRGAMGKVFRKSPDAFSNMYRVHMLYWLGITSSGSHGIHATSPNLYSRLGRPASHGCIRQHRADARALYGMVSVGTPVYVF